MRLNKRIADLEARQASETALVHLSDEELDTYGFDLIARFEAAGIALPDDWHEQYSRNKVGFLEGLAEQARELVCD